MQKLCIPIGYTEKHANICIQTHTQLPSGWDIWENIYF